VEDAIVVVFATLVAVTEYVPAAAGAVYKPEVEIEPPETDQVTAVLLVPLTVALNCWLAPVCRDIELGEIEMLTFRHTFDRAAVASTTLPGLLALSPEHPAPMIASDKVKSTTTKYRSREIRMNPAHFRGAQAPTNLGPPLYFPKDHESGCLFSWL
jgi:hypothetical protein